MTRTTRQPIVAVLGHVDHGKTSLLDRIRGSAVASREAGRITQHIGATEVPLSTVEEVCGPILGGRSFSVPGLLFIDTPGHHAFASLRSRGGALADIAVLVVDVTEGFKPQTKEALNILRRNRTPFVVAANKTDLLPGWDEAGDVPFVEAMQDQPDYVASRLDEAIYELVGDIHEITGQPANRYDRIDDFTQNVAVVPISAETGMGIPDLLLVLMGLAQRFLEKQLETDVAAQGQGTVLEVKEEKGFGLTLDTIVVNGTLRQGDHLVIAGATEPHVTRVKALLKPKPLSEIRESSQRFEHVDEVAAAAGVKVAAPDLEGVTAGAPFRVATEETLEAVREELQEEFRLEIDLEDDGVVIKADTLGSLEALAQELEDREIPIHAAEVGDVSRKDVVVANTINEPLRRAILGFNVEALPDADGARDEDTSLFTSEVIYELLDQYEVWVEQREKDLEEELRADVVHPGRFEILPDHVFRISKPAIVGVRVQAGRIRPGQRVLRRDGRVVGHVKSIRVDEKSLPEAQAGDEVAIALAGVTVGRQVEDGEVYYVDIPEGDAKYLFQDGNLNHDEMEVLEQVAIIKREDEKFWAM